MPTILNQRPRAMKWQKYHGDILPLWVADMDFSPPVPVQKAISEAVSDLGYQLPSEQANQNIAQWLHDQHHLSIDPQWVSWQAGVISGFNAALASVCEPGDEVIVPCPTYPPMRQAPANHGATCIELPLSWQDNEWTIDLAQLELQLARPQCKALLISNPMNPTGQVYRQLKQMVLLCAKYDVLLISDEIHADLVLHGPSHTSALAFSAQHDLIVVLMAASKTFNIAGLATSYMICPNPSLRKRIHSAVNGVASHANALGVIATSAAYEHGYTWLEQTKVLLRNNLNSISHWQSLQPDIISYPVQATYLAWMDWRKLTDKPYQHLLSYGVALSDGEPFGAPGRLRINFACSEETLTQALTRISTSIEALK